MNIFTLFAFPYIAKITLKRAKIDSMYTKSELVAHSDRENSGNHFSPQRNTDEKEVRSDSRLKMFTPEERKFISHKKIPLDLHFHALLRNSIYCSCNATLITRPLPAHEPVLTTNN